MMAVRQRDTALELALRDALFAQGLRYRLNVRREGTSIDIAFVGLRLAIFCDGCFWHGCSRHTTLPKRNRSWWKTKIEGNVARDRRLRRTLARAGWSIIKVWGHEDADEASVRIADRLGALRRQH